MQSAVSIIITSCAVRIIIVSYYSVYAQFVCMIMTVRVTILAVVFVNTPMNFMYLSFCWDIVNFDSHTAWYGMYMYR